MSDTTKKKSHVDFKALATFLKSGKYPPGLTENEKRTIRKRTRSFQLVDDVLYYIASQKDSDSGDAQTLRTVITEEDEINKIIAEYHVDDKGNHYGREKLGAKIRDKYYFLGLTNAVHNYIDHCPHCQIHRPSSRMSSIASSEESFSAVSSDTEDAECTHSTGDLHVASDVKAEHSITQYESRHFWEVVEFSALGPYKCKDSDFYVIVFLDLFSNWPEAYVVDSLSPSTITHLVLKLICRFGSMKKLMIHEHSPAIRDNITPRQDIFSHIGFDIDVTKCGSNQTYAMWDDLKGRLKNFTDNNSHWPFCLDFCLLPFRISRAENSEYTPAYITYGRELNLPQELSHQHETSCMAAEPHLSDEQMSKISSLLLDAFKMFGTYSPPLESSAINDLPTKGAPKSGKSMSKSSVSPKETASPNGNKAYNTRRSKDVDYRRMSVEEAEEDMPPPAMLKSPEPRRKRRKMSRPGRIKVEEEDLEERLVQNKELDDGKNSSLDEDTWEAVRRDIAHQVLANFHRSTTTDLQSLHSTPEPPQRRKYICDACGKEFSRSDTLKRHRRETHENEVLNPNICNECGLSFKRKDHLRRHQNSAHKGQLLRCKYCEKTFSTRNKLDYHIMLEHDKRFQCTQCDKRFGSSTSFKRHVTAHENSDYRCPFCLQDFETKEVTNIHKEVCKLTMKYPCTVCGEAFKSKSSFQHHEASHYDGKFPCHTCGIKFSFSTNLNRHIRTVHSKDPDGDVAVTTQKETSIVVPAPKEYEELRTSIPRSELDTQENDTQVPVVSHENTKEKTALIQQSSNNAKIVTEAIQCEQRQLEKQNDVNHYNENQSVSMNKESNVVKNASSAHPRPDKHQTEEESIAYTSKLHRFLREEYRKSGLSETMLSASHSEQVMNTTATSSSYTSPSVRSEDMGKSPIQAPTYDHGRLPSVSVFNNRITMPTMYGYNDLQNPEKTGPLGSAIMSYGVFPHQLPLTTSSSIIPSYNQAETHHQDSSGDASSSHTFTDQRTLVMPAQMPGLRDNSILNRSHVDLARSLQGVSQEGVTFAHDQSLNYQNQLSSIYMGRSEYPASQEKL